jgi:hypothetical protein
LLPSSSDNREASVIFNYVQLRDLSGPGIG